jgi:hypothetical protein
MVNAVTCVTIAAFQDAFFRREGRRTGLMRKVRGIRGWSSLGHYTAAGSLRIAPEIDFSRVEGWERERRYAANEWGLVVFRDCRAYENEGEHNRFRGFSKIPNKRCHGAVFSHTHPKGFPPSDGDIRAFLHCPRQLREFRVAASNGTTYIFSRTGLAQQWKGPRRIWQLRRTAEKIFHAIHKEVHRITLLENDNDAERSKLFWELVRPRLVELTMASQEVAH